MALPANEGRDAHTKYIRKVLDGTPYECTKLDQLTGGSVNFVYCGTPRHRRAATENEPAIDYLLVKHSTSHLSCNEDFVLEVSRWNYEKFMLDALNNFKVPETENGVLVQTPKLWYANDDAHVSVIEYVCSSINLTYGLTASDDPALSKGHALAVGVALGKWLRAFHDWTSQPAQEALRAHVRQSSAMRDLKFRVEYGIVFKVLENFPDILMPHRHVLVEAIDSIQRDMEQVDKHEHDADLGVIHGDFCTGNILVSEYFHDTPMFMDLHVIDWEYTQYGHRAHDLGQMIADVLERKHFEKAEIAMLTLEALVESYGDTVNDSMAFRAAIHAGAHMLGWHTRRAPGAPLSASPEVVSEFMELATLFIAKGWQKDSKFFSKTALACLFVTHEAEVRE